MISSNYRKAFESNGLKINKLSQKYMECKLGISASKEDDLVKTENYLV